VDKKPPILSVAATAALFLLEGKTTRKRLLPLLLYFLQIFWMKDTCAVVRRHHLFHCEAGIVKHRLICIEKRTIRFQHVDGVRDCVDDPSKLLFVLPQLEFRSLSILDVEECPVPLNDVSFLIAQRHVSA